MKTLSLPSRSLYLSLARALSLPLALALAACGDEGSLVIRSRSNASGASGSSGASGRPAGDGLAGQGGAKGGQGGAGGSLQGGQGGSGAGQGGSGGAAQPVRTVSQRNPFGHVQPDNLLWDGDLEWSGPFVSQYSWSMGKDWSPSDPPDVGVFPECRSGLKCARLVKSGAMGGMAVSPRTPGTKIKGWARVEPGNACSKVGLYLSGCFSNKSLKNPAKPVAAEPDEQGWCSYDDELPTLQETPCLFVVNKTLKPIFADDFYLGPGSSQQTPPETSALPDAEATAAVSAVRSHLREQHRNPGARPAPKAPSGFPRVR